MRHCRLKDVEANEVNVCFPPKADIPLLGAPWCASSGRFWRIADIRKGKGRRFKTQAAPNEPKHQSGFEATRQSLHWYTDLIHRRHLARC